ERVSPQLPTQRRDGGGQMQKGRQSLCGFMGRGRTQRQQRFPKSLRHPGARKQESRKAFGKNATCTAWLATEEPSCPQLETQRIASTGNIPNAPLIVAVLRRRGGPTHRAASNWGSCREHEMEGVIDDVVGSNRYSMR